MVTEDLKAKAEALADGPYRIEVSKDKTVDGKDVYFVEVIELPGCVAQGFTVEEALESIGDALVDYIFTLLEDGQPVPSAPISTTTGTTASFYEDMEEEPVADFEADLRKVTRPAKREKVAELSWVA